MGLPHLITTQCCRGCSTNNVFHETKSCPHDLSLDYLNVLKGPNSYNQDDDPFIELPNSRFPIPASQTYD